MRLLISAEGDHEPKGHHHMIVDGHGMLIDLRQIAGGTLHDPTIAKVTWGSLTKGTETRDGGTIVRRDGSKQFFFETGPLKPYLAAFEARKAALAAEQADFDAKAKAPVSRENIP